MKKLRALSSSLYHSARSSGIERVDSDRTEEEHISLFSIESTDLEEDQQFSTSDLDLGSEEVVGQMVDFQATANRGCPHQRRRQQNRIIAQLDSLHC